MNTISPREYFAAHSVSTQAERTMYQQAHGFKEPTRFEDHVACDTAVRYLKADAMIASSGKGNLPDAEKCPFSLTSEFHEWLKSLGLKCVRIEPAPDQPAPPAENAPDSCKKNRGVFLTEQPAEKSQSDGAAMSEVGRLKLELEDVTWKFNALYEEAKSYKRVFDACFHLHKSELGNHGIWATEIIEALSATPKPELKVPFAATLAADGDDMAFRAWNDKHGSLDMIPFNAGKFAWRAACAYKEQQTSARLKEAEAKLAESEVETKRWRDAFRVERESHFNADQKVAEQAVAKERATILDMWTSLEAIQTEPEYQQAYDALHARLTQPSNQSGEANAP
jgi:hypothetical protein